MPCVFFVFQTTHDNQIIDNACKIGYTRKDPKVRLSQLQVAHAKELIVYKTIETEYVNEWETFLHSILKYKHIRGEWYYLATDEVDLIHEQYEKHADESPSICYTAKNPHENEKIANNNVSPPHTQFIVDTMNININSKAVTCPLCDQLFQSKQYFKRHQRNKVPCTLECPTCDKKYEKRKSLESHMKTHK